ncbi:MAG: type VI secretion system baseplate subunit TssE [Phycisphaerales bacterium]|nr:type VI secretion system baseplate subunit TssE [Phycisphaerales bacterium]MCB9841095.1 type VI secretion system baseplate subunit TssE [Phycisphaeraceae bacterium]
MADLSQSERLQPCLLDRLSDDDPDVQVESRERRVMSIAQLRRAVLRDIEWLFNAANKDNTGEFEDYPQIRSSTLNYGMPDLCGVSIASLPEEQIERMVREAIERFEPRLIPGATRVRVSKGQKDKAGQTSLSLEIESDMFANPMPEAVFLRTSLDLETGRCTLQEGARG